MRRRFALVPLAALALVVALAGSAFADPPGNNGTVKVDDTPFDDHPNNEPHVSCIFQIDFYGYDAGGMEASYLFEIWPPTGPMAALTSGSLTLEDDAAGGGTDLDGSVTVDLSTFLAAYTPHPIQGHHVKLTVNAEGSIGADVKHKVFWVGPCPYPPIPTDLAASEAGPAAQAEPGGGVPLGLVLLVGAIVAVSLPLARRLRAARTSG